MKKLSFGQLLKRYRKLAGFNTLAEFADALADEGLVYSESILSRWQRGSRLPNDRGVYLIIFRVLIAYGAISNIAQANQLLSSANMGFLSSDEILDLLTKDDLKLNMSFSDTVPEKDAQKTDLVKITLVLPKHLNKYLDWVSSEYKLSKAKFCRQLIENKMETISEPYPVL